MRDRLLEGIALAFAHLQAEQLSRADTVVDAHDHDGGEQERKAAVAVAF
jgi:hypothetical protein